MLEESEKPLSPTALGAVPSAAKNKFGCPEKNPFSEEVRSFLLPQRWWPSGKWGKMGNSAGLEGKKSPWPCPAAPIRHPHGSPEHLWVLAGKRQCRDPKSFSRSLGSEFSSQMLQREFGIRVLIPNPGGRSEAAPEAAHGGSVGCGGRLKGGRAGSREGPSNKRVGFRFKFGGFFLIFFFFLNLHQTKFDLHHSQARKWLHEETAK